MPGSEGEPPRILFQLFKAPAVRYAASESELTGRIIEPPTDNQAQILWLFGAITTLMTLVVAVATICERRIVCHLGMILFASWKL